jgi:hypothetical protein
MKYSGTTGEKVKVPGVYRNRFGKQVTLDENTVFPPCPKEGKSITWEKVE